VSALPTPEPYARQVLRPLRESPAMNPSPPPRDRPSSGQFRERPRRGEGHMET
jgi:hypothetical protein